jgi:hypothetical protein
MSCTLTSTRAMVSDVKKVREIVRDYKLKGVEVRITKKGNGGVLVMDFQDDDPDWWEDPAALHRTDWPTGDLHEDEYGEDDWHRKFEKKGESGFLSLLRELAPLLQDPLVILGATRAEMVDVSVQAWLVMPNAEDVQTIDLSV